MNNGYPSTIFQYFEFVSDTRFFCMDVSCDCNRVMIGVSDFAQRSSQTILSVNYAFDPHDPLGPFIDPLNPATPEGLQLFPLVKQMLEKDQEYVERVKNHYQMMKRIGSKQEMH